MLKSRVITLAGRDEGLKVRLTELPAMLADAHARMILRQLEEEQDGGISALAFKHSRDALKLGADTLLPFLDGAVITFDPSGERAGKHLDVRKHLHDWRNVERLQNAAMLLHVDFMIGREALEVPVTFQAQQIMAGGGSLRATFCSLQIAAVLESQHASYRELETVLSTEDVFNLVEIINIAAIREWTAHQQAAQ
jgi:hypothetical protein